MEGEALCSSRLCLSQRADVVVPVERPVAQDRRRLEGEARLLLKGGATSSLGAVVNQSSVVVAVATLPLAEGAEVLDMQVSAMATRNIEIDY